MANLSNVSTGGASPTSEAKLQDESKNNTTRVIKRNYTTMIASGGEESEGGKANEKRPAFQLHPPTLIHGQTKPIMKSKKENISKCKFLQAPKLSAPSTFPTSSSAVDRMDIVDNSKQFVSKSNPFLKMSDKDLNEERENKEDSNNQPKTKDWLQSTEKSPFKVNENCVSEKELPHSSTSGETNDKDEAGSTSKTRQMTSPSDKSTSSFVFGNKMEDRATVNSDTKPSSKDGGDGKPGTSGFVFGQNFSDRAKVSSNAVSAPSLFLSPSGSGTVDSSFSDHSGFSSDKIQNSSLSGSEKKQLQGLKEDAAAHFLASQTKHVMPEVDVSTGEEDEKNVLQMPCKLHQFEASTQTWVERAVGNLRLNDGKTSEDKLNFQSRLVIRAHGSFRLALNTKIWAQMAVERANKKSIRITAQTEEGDIGVFLITCTINDAEQIFRALEYRVLHQKQLEEKKSENHATNADSSNVNKDQDQNVHLEEVAGSKKSSLEDTNEQQQQCDNGISSKSADEEGETTCGDSNNTNDSTTCADSNNAKVQPTQSNP